MSDLVYRVYWRTVEGWREEEYASLTEASIRKAALKRMGLTGRIVGIRTTISQSQGN